LDQKQEQKRDRGLTIYFRNHAASKRTTEILYKLIPDWLAIGPEEKVHGPVEKEKPEEMYGPREMRA
jgi:hypothetical protein